MIQDDRMVLLDDVLEKYVDSLKISDSQFEEARLRYESVGKWLRESSALKDRRPEIYTQGSFLFGTVVRPLTEEDRYDIDLVCRLNYLKNEISQKDLKEKFGKELTDYALAKQMKSNPKKKRRCWTIEYEDDIHFHMDFLPSIPDQDMRYRKYLLESGVREALTQTSICITDDTLDNYSRIDDDWLKTNPKGYAEWFKSRMRLIFEKGAVSLLEKRLYASVEAIPVHKIRTPLQKTIQLLKRHRDIMFENEPKKKPISMIITTLAAHAYQNEARLIDALKRVVDDMDKYIEKDGATKTVIRNPVMPDENFADKWVEDPALEKNFYDWLGKIRKDLQELMTKTSSRDMIEYLGIPLGSKVMGKVLEKYGYGADIQRATPVKSYPEVKINPSQPWSSNGRCWL
ncbi:MAG: nucleotidyltransferase [Candidatus Omnitrophica bacterium]|nr:nucleotidyltransferase [Candidatus Omnitrophota bacterium]MDD5610769.1 nucleotidyltransferase [Candidatus Omnitrophota bacterium]